MAEPQSTNGKPLEIPKMKMVRSRRSQYSRRVSRMLAAALSGSAAPTSPVPGGAFVVAGIVKSSINRAPGGAGSSSPMKM